jgi:hypothetical protein
MANNVEESHYVRGPNVGAFELNRHENDQENCNVYPKRYAQNGQGDGIKLD